MSENVTDKDGRLINPEDKLSRTEQDELSGQFTNKILTMFNEELFPLMNRGDLAMGSTVYVGTVALAQACAVLMFDSTPAAAKRKKELIASFMGILEESVEQVISGEAFEEEVKRVEVKRVKKESAWDKH